MTRDVIVVLDGACPAPVGSYGGSLQSVDAHEFGATAVRAALSRGGIDAADVDEVIMGQVGQAGPDAYNPRRVAIAAGLSETVPAFNVNRLCGSRLQAVWSAAQQLHWGGADVVVAGGNESMSHMPFLDYNARGNPRLGHR
jgi:acetyl-CoA C-acetyltransferase